MGTILTGETLQDLNEGDRITYHGVRWQVCDRSTYQDDKGYTTLLLAPSAVLSLYIKTEVTTVACPQSYFRQRSLIRLPFAEVASSFLSKDFALKKAIGRSSVGLSLPAEHQLASRLRTH
jgi:hypothetical protein